MTDETAAGESRFGDERFTATYTLTGDAAHARARADDLCVEQTIEFPPDLVDDEAILGEIVGRVVSLQAVAPDRHTLLVSYATSSAATTAPEGELTQLLNVLFGNSSLHAGVRLEHVDLAPSQLARYRGPRFGRAGLRALVGAPRRPLVCTALKPMGLAPDALAALAYDFARGGADLVKDDHGLADQPFCPYEARVRACAEAVARANRETGGRCLYLANATASAAALDARARFAREAGAGGLMLAPGLVGFDTVRRIADDDAIGLPIVMHPALVGTYVATPGTGLSPFALYGQLARLAGADAVIFPSFGGRFRYTEHDCRTAVAGTGTPMGALRPIFPIPAGGMTLDRVDELTRFYGPDTVLLIGGDLHRHGPDLAATIRRFRDRAEAACAS